MTDDNRDKFNYLAGQYHQTIKFYNVEVLCKEKIEEFRSFDPHARVGIGGFFRFCIPDVLAKETKKVIYLDCDTYVTMDISEYWNVELGDKIFGVVTEKQIGSREDGFPLCVDDIVSYDRYFNSGSLLINIEKFAQAFPKIKEGILFINEHPKYRKFNDQSLLNYCFSEDTLILPIKFNARINYLWRNRVPITEGCVVHYIMHVMSMDTNGSYHRLFFKYFIKTPWFTERTFANIDIGIRSQYGERKNLSLRFANFISGKERVFYIAKDKVDRMKKFFEIKESEKINEIDSGDENRLFKLSVFMSDRKNNEACIFVIDDYNMIKNHLNSQGFKEWEDFIDGKIILPPPDGQWFNTAPLIYSM